MTIKQRNGTLQKMRTGLIALALLAILTPWVQGASPIPATNAVISQSPFTMRGTWSFSEDADVSSSKGLWIGIESQGKHSLVLAWVPEEGGWWASWQLVLASETGSLPVNTVASRTIPGWQNSKGIALGSYTPIAGHRYEPMISYDPQSGALSVSLADLTTGKLLQANGYNLPVFASSFSSSGGMLGEVADQANATNNIRTSAEYVPAGTTWRIGSHQDGTFVTNSIINRKDIYYLQLNVEGPAPRGLFRVYLQNNGTRRELNVKPKLNGEVSLPTADMPLGKSQLVLEYSDQGRVVLSDSRDFTLGQINAGFSNVTVDRTAPSANSTLRITSNGPLSGINVTVAATVSELIWDKEKRNYREIVNKKDVLNLAQGLTIAESSAIELPVKISLPNKPSLWKINLQPIVSPDISVTAVTRPMTVNTYAAPVIEPDQPFTIAVLPDTQYFSGYAPVILDRMTQWLLEEADKQNIALALQVGDITDRNSNDQWENAQRSFSQLNGLIPYAMALGNHDQAPIGVGGSITRRGESQFAKYFSPEYFTGLQGSYPKGRLDNTYHTFKIHDVDYLVVSLEFAPPNDVLDWANKVVDSFPHHKTIVITHYYLATNGLRAPSGASTSYPIGKDKTTTMNDGADMWYKFVRNHENIFMVFNGHVNGVGVPYHIDKGVHGNTVYEFLVDYQDHTDGWLVTLQFTQDNKININTYSPYLDKNKTDVNKYGFTNRYQIDMAAGRISYKF